LAETLLDYNPEQPLEMRYEIGGEVSATCTAFGIDEMRGNPPSVRVSPGIQAVMPLPPPKTSSFEIRVDVEGEPGANYLLSASLHQRRRLPRVRIMSGIVSDRRVEHHVLTLTALSARLRLSDFDSLGIKEWPDIAQGRIAEDILHFKYPPSPDVSESELDDERDGSDYQVWYGTNRRPEVWAGSIIDFTSARDTVVHYGRCRVSVPKSHEIGSIGSPWWKRLLRRSDDRLSVAAIQSMSEEAYWSAIAKTLSELPMGERHIVVFLHGYNVSFKDAAIRAAQLGCDLSISGVMSFFSWPSRGTYRGYLADAATIEATESFITRFLIDMANVNNASNVHVIAHSMGN